MPSSNADGSTWLFVMLFLIVISGLLKEWFKERKDKDYIYPMNEYVRKSWLRRKAESFIKE